jgi:hypothetical protein
LRKRTEFLWRLLGVLIATFLGVFIFEGLELLKSHPLLNYGIIAIVGFACLATIELRLQGFSKARERLMPRERPASHETPRLVQLFFLFVPKRNREHIIGDLEEEYRTTNKRFPRLWYWGQVSALVASYWWATLRRLLGFDVVLKMIRK